CPNALVAMPCIAGAQEKPIIKKTFMKQDFLGFRERDVHGVLRCVPWSGRERYRPGGGRAENTSARPNHIGQAEPRWKIPKGSRGHASAERHGSGGLRLFGHAHLGAAVQVAGSHS